MTVLKTDDADFRDVGLGDLGLGAAGAARHPTRISLWAPLTPLFLILAPFALITAPLVWVYPPARWASPWRTAWAIGAALLALSGTDIDIQVPRALVRIRIRVV